MIALKKLEKKAKELEEEADKVIMRNKILLELIYEI